MAQEAANMPGGGIVTAPNKMVFDWKRIFFILLGLAFFFAFYFMSDLPDAVDPAGKHFPLPPRAGWRWGCF